MRYEERLLLDNLLDAFDRLFDHESQVVDTQALLVATGLACPESGLAAEIAAAAEALEAIVRSTDPELDKTWAALDAVQPLREKVAYALGVGGPDPPP